MMSYIIAFICTVIIPIVGLCFILYRFTKRIKGSKGKSKLFYFLYIPLLFVWIWETDSFVGIYYDAVRYKCKKLVAEPGVMPDVSPTYNYRRRSEIHTWFNVPYNSEVPWCENDAHRIKVWENENKPPLPPIKQEDIIKEQDVK